MRFRIRCPGRFVGTRPRSALSSVTRGGFPAVYRLSPWSVASVIKRSWTKRWKRELSWAYRKLGTVEDGPAATAARANALCLRRVTSGRVRGDQEAQGQAHDYRVHPGLQYGEPARRGHHEVDRAVPNAHAA